MAEETKEMTDIYMLYRMTVYILVVLEIFVFALDPEEMAFPGFFADIHERMTNIVIYNHNNLEYSKLATLIMIVLTSIGTKAKKQIDFDGKTMVLYPLIAGLTMIILSVFLYYADFLTSSLWLFQNKIWIYILFTIAGTILTHIALDNISKNIREGVMKDRFNFEMEAFEQNEELKETKYSVNIPMRYYYQGKFRHGWININNPFRGTFVIGTPGSGKSFSVVEPFIRQQSKKGFSMVVYDYKFPTLAQKLYYHYKKNQKEGHTPKNCKFNIINFVNVEYSKRVNPLQHKYIPDLAAAQETAETLVQSLQKGKESGGGGSDNFFQTSAVNFLAACIFFFVNYKRLPYDKDGNELKPEYIEDPETHHKKLTGRVFDAMGNVVEPDHWLGQYSDMPHVLSFLNHDYKEIFEILQTDPEVYPLLGPFMTAYKNKAMEQLEGMIGTLRVQTSRLATKEAYWIFHRDGDDFDLKVSDPANPSYLLIANDPEKESIIGALNAMILNRLVTRVNSGQGKNIPVSIIVDELPTLYFHKIENLIATARSNKVCVLLGFQELPQLEGNYGKVNMEKITATVGNVISGSARNKETLDWLSNHIMGKIVQTKTNLSIDESKTSTSINEALETMLPSSKIADMATGWLCGQVARDFSPTKTGIGGTMNIQESEEFKTSKFFCKTNFDMDAIKKEEDDYKNFPLPTFYKFKSTHEKERILYKNYERVGKDVDQMIKDIQMEFSKE